MLSSHIPELSRLLRSVDTPAFCNAREPVMCGTGSTREMLEQVMSASGDIR